MEIRIELKNVSKRYANKKIFSDLNFSFNQGCYHIVGENGAGKSTLLRLISALESPDSGTVFMKNANSNLSQRIFYIPDDLAVYPFLTGIEFVSWIAKLRTQQLDEVSDILEQLELNPHQHTAIGKMSLGTKKKFLLASGLIGSPDFIVFDEPLNGLDKYSQSVFIELLSEKCKSSGIILTTHHEANIELLDPIRVVISHNKLTEEMKVI